ncbi:hypothetical protein [Chryseobacterium sp. JV558]|nr:hypothetical protein [Chryseobacterium sp. JV558]MDW9379680.1 hypothetical protein [Chryseobacterium sp. JV558]
MNSGNKETNGGFLRTNEIDHFTQPDFIQYIEKIRQKMTDFIVFESC